MMTPATPHYHVIAATLGSVWTDVDEMHVRYIGRAIRSGGIAVSYLSCPLGSTCPEEILYRWRTGRAPPLVRPKYGRRPKKSLAHERSRA